MKKLLKKRKSCNKSKMKNNIKEIARIVGVSPSTVSRVFNKRPYVKEEIVKKVLETAKKLNYSPKQTARKTNIGILIEGIDTINIGEYEKMLITTLAKYMLLNNFTFEIIPISEIDFIYKHFYDVIISIIYGSETTEKIKDIKDIPIITINNPIEGCFNIYSDHRQGIEIAVDYLFSKGHKKIGLFRRNSSSWGSEERLKGYIDGLKRNKIGFDKDLTQEEDKNGTLLQAIAKICKKSPTAIISCGEDTVIEVLYSLNLINKKVPDDISIISFEITAISKYLVPPQTTIYQNFEKIGETAVEMVRKIMKGEKVNKEIVIKNEIIERETVKEIK